MFLKSVHKQPSIFNTTYTIQSCENCPIDENFYTVLEKCIHFSTFKSMLHDHIRAKEITFLWSGCPLLDFILKIANDKMIEKKSLIDSIFYRV